MKRPEDCTTKQDIRSEIDRIDRELVRLLAERHGYIHRMAQLKQDPDEAYVQERIDDVLDKVAAKAQDAGLDPALARHLWAKLMDWNIEYERKTIAARKASKT
jgi:isochorismate pyruvate lyase